MAVQAQTSLPARFRRRVTKPDLPVARRRDGGVDCVAASYVSAAGWNPLRGAVHWEAAPLCNRFGPFPNRAWVFLVIGSQRLMQSCGVALCNNTSMFSCDPVAVSLLQHRIAFLCSVGLLPCNNMRSLQEPRLAHTRQLL